MTLSVKFFKRLFLAILILLIVVPIVLAVYFGISAGRNQDRAEKLDAKLTKTEEKLEETEQKLSWVEQQLETAGGQQTHPSVDDLPPSMAYQALYPDLYCQADRTDGWERPENTVYLTFDDGPSESTDAILNILAQYDIKATFFVTGRPDDPAALERMKRIVDEGHSIGVYTYSRQYRDIYASVSAYLEDFEKMYTLIYETTGVKPEIFRFAGGSINGYNMLIYQPLIAEMTRRGFTYYDWNAAGGDNIQGITAEAVRTAVLRDVSGKDRAVVLLHDGTEYSVTAEALPGIIEGLKSQNYSFAPLTAKTAPVIFGYNSIP